MYDDDMSDEQYMRELYNRFRKDIIENSSDEYYTQDELLDIFDYAQDENDHLTMLYVLLNGARYYAESDFLDERKALLLSTVNTESARAMLTRKGRKDTPLWRVLDIALDCVEGTDPEAKLDALTESDMTLDSEAVIWLIDNLHAARRHDLILQNVERIVEMAEDPAEVYHSAAMAFYNEGGEYYVHALAMAEELTRTDSFFVDGWILSARIEFQLDHYKQALQAIDYALALEPDNTEAQWVRAMILPLSDTPADPDTVTDHLRNAVKARPEWLPATKALAEQYGKTGNRSAMFATYEGFIASSHSTDDIVSASMEALRCNPDNPRPYLDAVNDAIRRDDPAIDEAGIEQQWNKIAIDLIGSNNPLQAETVYDYLYSRYGIRYFFYNYLAVCYRNRRYQKVVELSESPQMSDDLKRDIPSTDIESTFDRIKGWVYIAGAMLVVKRLEECVSICEKLLGEIPDLPYTVTDNIFVNGIRLQLRFLQQLAFHPDAIPADEDFDPLTTQVDTVRFAPDNSGASDNTSFPHP